VSEFKYFFFQVLDLVGQKAEQKSGKPRQSQEDGGKDKSYTIADNLTFNELKPAKVRPARQADQAGNDTERAEEKNRRFVKAKQKMRTNEFARSEF